MHDVLVDQARADLAQKRGGGMRQLPLLEVNIEQSSSRIDILDLQEALADLGAKDPEAARVVMLRFYAGLTLEEVAETMHQSFAMVRRHWEYARAWLHDRLTRKGGFRRSVN